MSVQSNGTNKSRFSALPGGQRMFYGETFGEFDSMGGFTGFWTSSEDSDDENSGFCFHINIQTLAGNFSSNNGLVFICVV